METNVKYKCQFCEDDVEPPFPSARAIERFEHRTRIQVTGMICCRCMNRLKTPKGNSQTLTKTPMTRLRAIASTAAMRGNYEAFADAENEVQVAVFLIEKEITHALDLVQQLNARRNDALEVQRQIANAMNESPHATYFLRRIEANRYISRPEVRQRIFLRDGLRCVRCPSRKTLSIDHIKPVKLGGTDDDSNLQTLCKRCNSSKGCTYVIPMEAPSEPTVEVAVTATEDSLRPHPTTFQT